MASAANRKDMQFEEFNASAATEHRTQYFRIVGANPSNDRRKCVKLLRTHKLAAKGVKYSVFVAKVAAIPALRHALTHPNSFGNNFHCMRKIDRSSLESLVFLESRL